MTTKDHQRPFLLRFSEPLPAQPGVRMRYDPVRQVSEVEVDGLWIDSTAGKGDVGGTRVTRMNRETTDDE